MKVSLCLLTVSTSLLKYPNDYLKDLNSLNKSMDVLTVKLEAQVSLYRSPDILKRTYLCQVSDTGSPEPLVYRFFYICITIG
jgi:hypothetical protein